MNGDLGFDLETALEKRPNEISKAKIDSLRASLDDLKSIPANITDKQVHDLFDKSIYRVSITIANFTARVVPRSI